MRRSLDDALLALREQLKAWSAGAPADIRVWVYPPEWEALVLSRLPAWAEARANDGLSIDVVDIGQEFGRIIDERRAAKPIAAQELRALPSALESLRGLARETIVGAIRKPLEPPAVARLLINTGSLAAFASYSAITNEFHGAADRPPTPVAIAFPGEGDGRSLSLMHLRPDANYRVPRI